MWLILSRTNCQSNSACIRPDKAIAVIFDFECSGSRHSDELVLSQSARMATLKGSWSVRQLRAALLGVVLISALLEAFIFLPLYTATTGVEARQSPDDNDAPKNRVAFLIKTHARPACLDVAVRSILLLVPDATVIVADDSSRQNASEAADAGLGRLNVMFPQLQLVMVSLEFDVGVSAGRNVLVDKAHELGFRYVFILDDDNVFTHDVDFNGMLSLLERGDADIVGANRCDGMPFDATRCMGHSSLVHTGDTLLVVPGASKYPHRPAQHGCVQTEFVQNAFMSTVAFLKRVRWDPVLKNNDHYDFFYRANFRHGGRVWICQGMHLLHAKLGCQSTREVGQRYAAVRANRWKELLPYVAAKLGFVRLIDEFGMVISVAGKEPAELAERKSSSSGVAASDKTVMSAIPDCVAMANWMRNDALMQMESQLMSLINSHLPGYYQRDAPTRINYCMQPFHPNLFRIRGALHSPYANWYPPTKEADYVTFDADLFYPTDGVVAGTPNAPSYFHNMTYPPERHLNHIRTLPLWSATKRPALFTVSVVKNCYNYAARMLNQMQTAALAGHPLHAILVDFGSTDGDYEALAASVRGNGARGSPLQVTVMRMNGAFSRAIGLHVGIEQVAALTGGDPDARIFVTDTSMVLPQDMPERIVRFTQCGHSAYMPIATKVLGIDSDEEALALFTGAADARYPARKRAPAMAGKGMVGFCLADYKNARGYDFGHGYQWGLEDEALSNDLLTAGLLVVRPQEPGFYHVQYKNPSVLAYHSKGNGAAPLSQLAIIPETVRVSPTHAWFRPLARYVADNHLGTIDAVWYTYASLLSGNGGTYHVQVVDDESITRLVVLHSGLGPRMRLMSQSPADSFVDDWHVAV